MSSAFIWFVTVLAGLGGFGTLCWFAGQGAKRLFDRYTDSVLAEKTAKAEAIAAKETIERKSNDETIQKNTNVIVDNLSDDDVLQRLQSSWKSPKQ